ncbi:hypothetical protein DBV15_07662 [Temnothorax longispinosus]|uniref:Uncharacterized protein n=1 Tax=Temnothorax longispinosus TaxID=300112 RepID=A0A4S2KPL1_9HYME|nr:hypothetical protein DBV15_07662 [Temnothorax longispinosus]
MKGMRDTVERYIRLVRTRSAQLVPYIRVSIACQYINDGKTVINLWKLDNIYYRQTKKTSKTDGLIESWSTEIIMYEYCFTKSKAKSWLSHTLRNRDVPGRKSHSAPRSLYPRKLITRDGADKDLRISRRRGPPS